MHAASLTGVWMRPQKTICVTSFQQITAKIAAAAASGGRLGHHPLHVKYGLL